MRNLNIFLRYFSHGEPARILVDLFAPFEIAVAAEVAVAVEVVVVVAVAAKGNLLNLSMFSSLNSKLILQKEKSRETQKLKLRVFVFFLRYLDCEGENIL